ncbi:MAG: site-2 protease family protein [Phycisphaeraceae bacterium]
MFDNPILAFLAFVVGFGFLIFVHELGHFLVAKAVGIKCTQFAIGFGQSLLSWRKGIGLRIGSTEPEYEKRLEQGEDEANLGETEYRLNWVPLGGYVKMLGQEDIDPAARSSDPRSFNMKPIWARSLVISAGVVMNIIFGLIFLVVAFRAGVEFPAPIVGGTSRDLPAATTYAEGHEGDPAYRGLEVGDRIVGVEGETPRDMLEVQLPIALSAPGEQVRLTVERAGVDEPLVYVMNPEPHPVRGIRAVGIERPMTQEIGLLLEDSPLYEAGVRPGMKVVAVAGEPADSYAAYYHAVTSARGEPVSVTFAGRREGEDGEPAPMKRVTAQVVAQPLMQQAGEAGSLHLLGFAPAARLEPVPDTPAAEAGVQAGDVVVQFGSVSWPTLAEVQEVAQNATEAVTLVVLRGGERMDLGEVTPKDGRIGVGLSTAAQPIVAELVPDTPAAAAMAGPLAKVPPGTRIAAVAGEPVESWTDVLLALQDELGEAESAGVALTLELPVSERSREQVTLPISAEALAAVDWAPPSGVGFQPMMNRVAGENIIDSAKIGVEKTVQSMTQVYLTLARLFQGTVKPEHLRGPAGIVHEGTRFAQQGWEYALFFLGIISINLAVINFLPIPIVDGGHMVFLLIERIKGSPPSATVQAVASYVGLALLALVFVVITYHDIARLVSG